MHEGCYAPHFVAEDKIKYLSRNRQQVDPPRAMLNCLKSSVAIVHHNKKDL